jgi:phosphoribosyl-AMP cyclohydrolase
MDRIEVVPGLEPEVLARVVGGLRALEPAAVAVLVQGSYARGTADEYSDLDVRALVPSEPPTEARMWFEERPGSALLHVVTVTMSIERWLAERNEAWDWALGLPALNEVRYAWATDEARAQLGESPSYTQPGREPQLAPFVEHVAKVRRASELNHGVAVRLYSRHVALLSPQLLAPLNDEVLVRDRLEALETALGLRVAPEHYRSNMSVCLTLVPATDDAVGVAAIRLGGELLAFLRAHTGDADPDLADGTIERYLGFLD